MNNYYEILEKLKESQEFRLIKAKDKVLDAAIDYLRGSTTDIEDYLYVFEQIEKNASLDEEFEKELISLNNKLNNTDDFQVPLTDEIEELCQKIRELEPHEDTQTSIWREQIALDKLNFSKSISFEEVFENFADYIRYNEKDIFAKIISYFKENEKEKEILIAQLEKELFPIKELANKMLTSEKIDKEYGSILEEICHTQAYSSNFYHRLKKERESILLKNSTELNELEKLELRAFFDNLAAELNVLWF
jgi:hypothetical protein